MCSNLDRPKKRILETRLDGSMELSIVERRRWTVRSAVGSGGQRVESGTSYSGPGAGGTGWNCPAHVTLRQCISQQPTHSVNYTLFFTPLYFPRDSSIPTLVITPRSRRCHHHRPTFSTVTAFHQWNDAELFESEGAAFKLNGRILLNVEFTRCKWELMMGVINNIGAQQLEYCYFEFLSEFGPNSFQ